MYYVLFPIHLDVEVCAAHACNYCAAHAHDNRVLTGFFRFTWMDGMETDVWSLLRNSAYTLCYLTVRLETVVIGTF